MIEKIKKLLLRYLTQAQFVFRFDYITKNGKVSDTNVVQYEFINQGTTVVEINGMELQPSLANLEPVRWQSWINDNENDVSIYAIKFIPITLKTCTGAICNTGFVPCPVPPPIVCSYDIDIFIDGVAILTAAVKVDCTMSEALIQSKFNLNLLPQYAGKLIISFGVNGLCFQFINIVIPIGNDGEVEIDFTTGGIGCPFFSPINFLLTCVFVPETKKLLVISKISASVRVHNP